MSLRARWSWPWRPTAPPPCSISPETGKQLRNLVREADALFGSRQFRRYTFLVTLSDQVAQFGLESHESSENRVAENSFTNPAVGMLELPVLAHEYVHSWNGKYRRPDGLVTPDFQAPMRGDLLWVYEGLTQYLGNLLTARSGLWPAERYRDRLAQSAAYYSIQPGRSWRPVADTAVAAQQLRRASPLWRSYRRSADYYNEGALVWLEADMLIREETRGRRSLDDFCAAFFGGNGPGRPDRTAAGRCPTPKTTSTRRSTPSSATTGGSSSPSASRPPPRRRPSAASTAAAGAWPSARSATASSRTSRPGIPRGRWTSPTRWGCGSTRRA